jgi:hypothetical protein
VLHRPSLPHTQRIDSSSVFSEVHLADSLAVGELPDSTRERIIILDGVKVGILECLWDKPSILRVISHRRDLLRIDVLVQAIAEVNLNRDIARQVKLRIQGASPVARLDGCWSAELVDPGSAGRGAIETGLDAVAFVLDLREGQVDFGDDASDIEAFDVADAALLGGLEVGADLGEAGVVVADGQGAGGDAKSEDGGDESDGGEMHFEVFY